MDLSYQQMDGGWCLGYYNRNRSVYYGWSRSFYEHILDCILKKPKITCYDGVILWSSSYIFKYWEVSISGGYSLEIAWNSEPFSSIWSYKRFFLFRTHRHHHGCFSLNVQHKNDCINDRFRIWSGLYHALPFSYQDTLYNWCNRGSFVPSLHQSVRKKVSILFRLLL